MSLDLSSYTEDGLRELQAEANSELSSRRVSKFEAFKKTDEFKELKKEYKALRKAGNALSKNHVIELNLPIKLTVSFDAYELGDFYGEEDPCLNWEDVFEADADAKLGKGYTGGLKDEVNQAIESAVRDACGEVLGLCPDLVKVIEAHTKEVSDFLVKCADTPLRNLGDLD